MAINAISPFEGTLEWVGEPNMGTTRNGREWKSVDFILKYTDHQMEEKQILFSAFGVERVDKLIALPKGTPLKIVWWPETTQSKDGSRYFTKNSVISIGKAKPEAKSLDTKITAPSFPEYPPRQSTALPPSSPAYAPISSPLDNSDLPFSQSPGVRG